MTPPAASAAAAPAIHPRRTTGPRRAPATRRPRRISGPVNPARGQVRAWSGPAHAVGLAEAVATHRLLDRLIRGRMWIGVIAFALIGIVTMQLFLLKLNAGIGRSLVRETLLQRENATLSAENSEVAAGEQVEARAEHAGMELIPSGAVRFLTAHPSTDASKAAAALSAWSAGSGAATGTTTTGESSSAAEAGASSSDASAQAPGTTGAGAGTEPAGAGTSSSSGTAGVAAATSTGAAGSTAETASAVSTGDAAGQAAGQTSASETDAGSSTGEAGAGATHPSETTVSPGASAAGASEATSQSTPASTGGDTGG